MPRFIDSIRRTDPHIPYALNLGEHVLRGINWEFLRESAHRNKLLKEAPAIVADNIAEWIYGTDVFEATRRFWELDEIPNAAPPFENFWIEWTPPHLSERRFSRYIGLHFYVDKDHEIPLHESVQQHAGERFQMHADLYFYDPKTETGAGPMVHWYIPVTDRGRIVTAAMSYDRRLEDAEVEWLKSYLIPGLVTIAFMHLPAIPKERVSAPKPLAKKYLQRHGWPLVRYYTLKFEVMKKVLMTEGRARETGISRALHLCRGHWSHYTPDKPLFNNPKLTGDFYIQPHWRGQKEMGTVVKDYQPVPPTQDAAKTLTAKQRRQLSRLKKWATTVAAEGEEIEGADEPKTA